MILSLNVDYFYGDFKIASRYLSIISIPVQLSHPVEKAHFGLAEDRLVPD